MKKHCTAKDLPAISEIFSHENNPNINPTDFDIASIALRLCQNNMDTTFYQRCATLFRCCINVLMLYFVSFSTSDELYLNVDTQF